MIQVLLELVSKEVSLKTVLQGVQVWTGQNLSFQVPAT